MPRIIAPIQEEPEIPFGGPAVIHMPQEALKNIFIRDILPRLGPSVSNWIQGPFSNALAMVLPAKTMGRLSSGSPLGLYQREFSNIPTSVAAELRAISGLSRLNPRSLVALSEESPNVPRTFFHELLHSSMRNPEEGSQFFSQILNKPISQLGGLEFPGHLSPLFRGPGGYNTSTDVFYNLLPYLQSPARTIHEEALVRALTGSLGVPHRGILDLAKSEGLISDILKQELRAGQAFEKGAASVPSWKESIQKTMRALSEQMPSLFK